MKETPVEQDEFIRLLSETCSGDDPTSAALLQRILDVVNEGRSVMVRLATGDVFASPTKETHPEYAFLEEDAESIVSEFNGQ